VINYGYLTYLLQPQRIIFLENTEVASALLSDTATCMCEQLAQGHNATATLPGNTTTRQSNVLSLKLHVQEN